MECDAPGYLIREDEEREIQARIKAMQEEAVPRIEKEQKLAHPQAKPAPKLVSLQPLGFPKWMGRH